MTIISGVELTSAAQKLENIFGQWVKIYLSTHELFPQSEDVWYLEPTLTTMLVAAAWRCDVAAVGEVRSRRFRGGARSDGRIDCMLQISGRQVAVEAKIRWFDSVDGFDSVLGKLNDAEGDALSIDPSFQGQRLAICYGVIERRATDLSALLKSVLEKARGNSCDVLLWCLEDPTKNSSLYPGCVVIGKIISGPTDHRSHVKQI